MARRDALLRLNKALLGRRAELRNKLSEDLNNLRNFVGQDSTGDAANAAFESGSDEMASQLAELDSRELTQIDRALVRLKQGTYGECEACHTKIPVGRLNALPYTTMCISCQREMEKYPNWSNEHPAGASWEKVFDNVAHTEEPRDIDLSSLEIDMSK